MSEQTTGRLSEEELEAIKARDKEAAELIPEHVVLTRVDPDYRAECYCNLDRRALLSHIDYQDAKIERVERAHASLVADLKTIGDEHEAPTSYHGNTLAPAVRLSAFIADLKRKLAAALGNLRTAGIEATDPATGVYKLEMRRLTLQGEVEQLKQELAAANEAANNFENAAGHLADLFWAESDKLAKAEKQIAEIRAAGVGDEELAKRACAAWFGLRADHPHWSQRDHREGWIRSVRAVAAPFRARIAELERQVSELQEPSDGAPETLGPKIICERSHYDGLEQQIAELRAKLEAAEGSDAGEYEYECFYCGAEWSSPDAAEGHRLALAHNAECPDNPSRQVEAERDRLAAELGNWQAELKTVQSAIRISFNGPAGTPEYRHACEMLEHIAKQSPAPLTAAELSEPAQAPNAEAKSGSVEQFLADNPPAKEFTPYVCAPESGGLRAHWKPDPDRLDGTYEHFGIVLYRSLETNEIVGCELAAADHSVDANKKVEPPASEARRFVCPECESGPVCWVTVASTEGGTGELRCPECNWTGTWAEAEAAIKIPSTAEQLASIGAGQPPGLENEPEERPWAEAEAAKGEQSQSLECRIRKAYRRLDDPLFESAMDDLRGLECQLADARRECADCEESNEEIFKRFNRVCDQRNGYSEEVKLLKQQLAAERQAREAADRRATEKILELERRCNDEHRKCEAAEQSRIRVMRAYDPNCDVFVEADEIEKMQAARQTIEALQELAEFTGHDPEGCLADIPDEAIEHIRNAEDHAEAAEQRAEQLQKQLDQATDDGQRLAQLHAELEQPWCEKHLEYLPKKCPACRAEQAEAAAGVMVGVIQQALELCKEADNERLSGQEEAHRESAKWKAEGDMYGWNFHEGKAGGMNEASIIFYRVRRFIEAALASDAGRAAANELRALRTFRAEIEQDYQAWANATIGEAELRIRLGVARNKVDKAIAGQGGTGKEGR